jgi:AmiR/NasT family two-component response regulator
VEEAFARLRAQAFSHGRRLAEVAHLVLEGAQRPPDAP